jgi:hypothetical protein
MRLYQLIEHYGDAPGLSTYIGAALEDRIGIVVLVNAESKYTVIQNITTAAAAIAFGSADSSSPQTNQSTASRRSKQSRHASLTARAHDGDAPAPSDVDLLTGTYFNAGYGSGELCSVRSSSPSCKSVLDAFHAIDPSLSANSPDLFASWITLLSTHVRFTANDSQYLIDIGSIYPEGYGKNTTPFSTLAPGATAEFVVENENVVGFGWNDISDGVKRAGSVEETSDVWFVFVKQA